VSTASTLVSGKHRGPSHPTWRTQGVPHAAKPAEHATPTSDARFTTPLLIGAALNPVNSSLIATALVPIAAALGVPVGRTAILVSALYLVSAIAQPTAGRLAEEFGPRRVFFVGTILVLLGGLIGGLAQGLPLLTAARVLIGIGTSAAYPSAIVLLKGRAEAHGDGTLPTSSLSGMAIVAASTLALGPTLGGLLIGALGWRAAFLINVPLAALTLALILWWLPADRRRTHRPFELNLARRMDVLGMILFGATLIVLLLFLMALPRFEPVHLCVSALLGIALVVWELRAANPFFDVRTLATNRAMMRTYGRSTLALLGSYVILFGLTQWLQSACGYSPFQAGLVLAPMGLCSAFAAHLARHRSPRAAMLIAAALMILGAAAVTATTSHSPVTIALTITALFGAASGLSNVANQTALYREASTATLGTAFGLLRTFGYFGSIGASSISAIAFHRGATDQGLHHIGLALLCVSAAILILTAVDHRLAGISRADRATAT
jgi:MFS family permease